MATPSTQIIGGWHVIKDLSSPTLTEVAIFAIEKGTTDSKLEKVLHGQNQVIDGFQYLLVLSATNGKESKKYLAIVLQEFHALSLLPRENISGHGGMLAICP
ncbi:hypothetical protein Ahy_B01g051627 isoform B [Arachis hypogaea]|uniref:Cystatin domain-containing protein n=1 Tax=Arachis hypogaea TaxID=3818 RepID=A0A445AMD1_ARAHY|nr:hypothetical protein Ahy_B01g051627 isoform B [Arachis hypogaea]